MKIYALNTLKRRGITTVLAIALAFLFINNVLPTLRRPKRPENLFHTPDSGLLIYRSIGDNLPPLHKEGQVYDAVRHILENEPLMKGVSRRWMLWHMFDAYEQERIVQLLRQHQEDYEIKDFSWRDFGRLATADAAVKDPIGVHRLPDYGATPAAELVAYFKPRFSYLWGSELDAGALNAMLHHGFEATRAEWIIAAPATVMLDTLTDDLAVAFHSTPYDYILIPVDGAADQGVVAFRRGAPLRYNEKLPSPLDCLPEMLKSLGAMPGDAAEAVGARDLAEVRIVEQAGRLTPVLEQTKRSPADVLQAGMNILAAVDAAMLPKALGYKPSNLVAFDEDVLQREREAAQDPNGLDTLKRLISTLREMADTAVTFKPFSVTDKLETPPSGDKHDYFTPAPYYWPNPKNPKGPYIVIDGQRVPGTGLYDEQSEKYDRSRLSSFYGNTTVLALAGYFTGDDRYTRHAARNLKAWFVDESTRMNPHMRFAQLRMGHKKDIDNGGFQSGIIETKDFYFLLDAVRLVHRAGALSDTEVDAIRGWVRQFLDYITKEKQGISERKSANNHGTYYDIQVAALAAFVDDPLTFRQTVERSKARLVAQFAQDGSIPDEMRRPTQLHYMMFSLQGWYTLARIGVRAGIDLWRYIPEKERHLGVEPLLRRAAVFAVPYFNKTWSNHQAHEEDMERMLPLYYWARKMYPDIQVVKDPAVSLYDIKPRFNEHDGIQIFWNLGLTDKELS